MIFVIYLFAFFLGKHIPIDNFRAFHNNFTNLLNINKILQANSVRYKIIVSISPTTIPINSRLSIDSHCRLTILSRIPDILKHGSIAGHEI